MWRAGRRTRRSIRRRWRRLSIWAGVSFLYGATSTSTECRLERARPAAGQAAVDHQVIGERAVAARDDVRGARRRRRTARDPCRRSDTRRSSATTSAPTLLNGVASPSFALQCTMPPIDDRLRATSADSAAVCASLIGQSRPPCEITHGGGTVAREVSLRELGQRFVALERLASSARARRATRR